VRFDFRPLSRLPIASLSPRGSRPWYRPLTCFRFASSCEVDGISQVWMLPLSRSGRVRAPWSPTTCTRLLSPSPGRSRFSAALAASHRPLSPRGSRRQSRPFTDFRFASPCEAGGISQVWMLPLIHYGRIRAPWPPSSCARTLHPLSSPVTGADFRPAGLGGIFHRLSRFVHPVALTSRFPSDDRGLTTLLSITYAGVARPRPRYARYPSSFRRKSASWPPTILRQAPTRRHSSQSPERAFRLSP